MAPTLPTLLYQCFSLSRQQEKFRSGSQVGQLDVLIRAENELLLHYHPFRVALKDSNEDSSSREQSFRQHTWIPTLWGRAGRSGQNRGLRKMCTELLGRDRCLAA